MAHERLSDASVVGQSDMALTAVAVGAAATVDLAGVGSSDVVAASVGIAVGCGQRSFGFVCPLVDGPVRVAVEAESSIYALFFCFFSLFRRWNNLGATCE